MSFVSYLPSILTPRNSAGHLRTTHLRREDTESGSTSPVTLSLGRSEVARTEDSFRRVETWSQKSRLFTPGVSWKKHRDTAPQSLSYG